MRTRCNHRVIVLHHKGRKVRLGKRTAADSGRGENTEDSYEKHKHVAFAIMRKVDNIILDIFVDYEISTKSV